MADLTGVTTNYLPTAHETFEDTLSASCLAAATTVFITDLAQYDDDDVVVLTVDPGTANEATFTGVKKSTPYRVIDVVWTEGNVAVGHSSGATVIDYDSATHYNMLAKALKQIINQDGTLLTQPVRDALGLGTDAANGWEALGYAPNSIVDNGNGSYTATFNSVDLTGTTGVGDRMLLPRAATATQCATFDGVNDYFSKATPNKMTWTDDFTWSVWLKSPLPAATSVIASRRNGTQGWDIRLTATGIVDIVGYNASLANYSLVQSVTCIAVDRWVHCAGLLDMSAFTAAAATAETAKSWVMFNGVEQPAIVSRVGTNPTSLVQAGNLEIGTTNGGFSNFVGKMAQLAIYNTRVLQATIRASRNQPLTGSETSLASAYSFNNSITDLNTTTPNDLTPNGGVVATTNDTPFTNSVTGTTLTAGTRNYAIIVGQAFSTNTVYNLQVCEGETIPTTTPPTSVSYSKQKSPYGFPLSSTKWTFESFLRSRVSSTGSVSGTTYNIGEGKVKIPLGEWDISVYGHVYHPASAAVQTNGKAELSTSATTINPYGKFMMGGSYHSAVTETSSLLCITGPLSLAATTDYYLLVQVNTTGTLTAIQLFGDRSPQIISWKCAYL